MMIKVEAWLRLYQYPLVEVSDGEVMLRPALRLREEKNRENLKEYRK